MAEPILGQEAVAGKYGLGRVTNLDLGPGVIGVTPYVAGYEMHFAAKNVRLVRIDLEVDKVIA